VPNPRIKKYDEHPALFAAPVAARPLKDLTLLPELATSWRPPDMATLPSWKGAKRIAIDTETHDPQLRTLGPGVRRNGYMVGASVAIDDGPRFYLPWAHEGGDNLDKEQCLAYLRHEAKQFDGTVCGQHLQYDLDYLWEADVVFPQVKWYRDCMIADPLIYELYDSYRLNEICSRWGVEPKEESLLKRAAAAARIDMKRELWRLPARYVGAYAEGDVDRPLRVLAKQELQIDKDGLRRVYDLESRLLPVLVKYRRRGIRVDSDRTDKIEQWTLREGKVALDTIHRETGVTLAQEDVMKADAIKRVLDIAGIVLQNKTASGDDAVQSKELETINHPVAKMIVRARSINKIRTTYIAAIRKHVVRGRIHGTLNQLKRTDEYTDDDKGAAFGRLSGEQPNMQNQPGRDEETGPMWRAQFMPEDGCEWVTKDFSQQEPRWSFHLADMVRLSDGSALPGAAEMCEHFRNNLDADCYDTIMQLANIPRKPSKFVWLGRCYGMGGGKTAKVYLQLPTIWVVYDRVQWKPVPADSERATQLIQQTGARPYEEAGPEAQAIIDKFDAGLPFLKQLAQLAKKAGKARGYVLTASGRRCHFPRYGAEFGDLHKSLNKAIQGSAGDETKQAMVDLDDAGYDEVQLQVHDELDGSYNSRKRAQEAAEIMRSAWPKRVPTKVDIEIGPSWGESMLIGKPPRPYVWNL
jgi:DNA polymerase I-like protein with 3'-5' exonuclease and polymerase domains